MSKPFKGAAVIAPCLTALLVVGCGGSSENQSMRPDPARATAHVPSSGPRTGTSREFFQFTSLAEMVATSSVVIVGTVNALEPGRTAGSGMDQEVYTNAVVHVDDQLFGGPAAPDVRVEQLTSFAGDPIVLDGVEPSKLGDHGIYFLRRTDTGTYVLVSSQGRFLERGPRMVGTNAHDELVNRLVRLDMTTLAQRVREAKASVDSGQVQPQQGPPGLSR